MALYQSMSRVIMAYTVQEWNADAVAEWCGGEVCQDDDGYTFIKVDTVVGSMDALIGDTIARDNDGATFVLDTDQFSANFKMVA